MAISKVIYKSSASAQGETWMDLTADTVASGNLISPNTAHGADGQSITGSVGSGTEGTPTATKGAVSNHSVNITPSVTNTAGVISGGTHTGTQVTVTAAELESGTKSITQNGTGIDVTGYSTVDVAVPSGTAAVIDVVEQLPGGGEHHIITGVDISSDTVTAAHLETGYTAHDAEGNSIIGVLSPGNITDYLALIDRTFTGRLDGPAFGITKIGERAFDHCTGITSVFFTGVTKTGSNAMYSCTGVQTAVLQTESISTSTFFNGCSGLNAADIEASQIYGSCFSGCSSLTTLVIRNTSRVPMQNINAFNNTPFKSGGAGGTIYIPKALYDHLGDGTGSDYKAASNWSTIDGYGTITWAKIEGSIYESQYVDGTPIT